MREVNVRRAVSRLALLPLAFFGCEGHALNVGDDAPPPLVVPPDVASRCKPSPTTARTFATSAELEAALVGRWLRCRGVDSGALFAPGIELTADFNRWYELVDDGSGALTRSTADTASGHWTVEAPLTLNLFFGNNARQTLVVLFDPDGLHFSVERSTFDAADVGFVHE